MAKKSAVKITSVSDTVAVEEDLVQPGTTISEPTSPGVTQESMLAPINEYETQLAKFKPYLELKINGLEDKDGFKKVEAARLEVKGVKVQAKKVGDAIVAPINNILNQINERRKFFKDGFEEIEDYLTEQSKSYKDALEEAKRKEEEEREAKVLRRFDQIQTLGALFNGFNSYKLGEISISGTEIKSMTDEQFIGITTKMEEEGIRQREAQRLAEEEEKAEKARLEAVAEEQRLASEKLEKAQQDLKAAQEKLLADQEAARVAEEERLAKIAKDDEERQARIKKEDEDRAAAAKADAERAEQAKKELIVHNRRKDVRDIDVSIASPDTEVFVYKGTEILNGISDFDEKEWKAKIKSIPAMLKKVDKDLADKEKREAKVQADAQKALEDKIAQDLKDKAEAEKAEQARLEALRPDKEKLVEMAAGLKTYTEKWTLDTEEGKSLQRDLADALESLLVDLNPAIAAL